MKNCEIFKNKLSEYIDNALSIEETVSLEKHLIDCSECSKELHLLNSIIHELNHLPEQELPENFHNELMAKIKDISAKNNIISFPTKLRKWITPLASVASLVLILLLGNFIYPFTNNVNKIEQSSLMGTNSNQSREMGISTFSISDENIDIQKASPQEKSARISSDLDSNSILDNGSTNEEDAIMMMFSAPEISYKYTTEESIQIYKTIKDILRVYIKDIDTFNVIKIGNIKTNDILYSQIDILAISEQLKVNEIALIEYNGIDADSDLILSNNKDDNIFINIKENSILTDELIELDLSLKKHDEDISISITLNKNESGDWVLKDN